MTAAGYSSELHFGLDRESLGGPLKAHCWLVHGDRIVLNAPTEAMVPLLIHRAEAPSATAKANM